MGAGQACKVGKPHNAAALRILGMRSGRHADAAAENRACPQARGRTATTKRRIATKLDDYRMAACLGYSDG
jgi:hypothetical protein